jgi:hypothetical protein
VKWPNGIIGHSRLLQQNRHFADIADAPVKLPLLSEEQTSGTLPAAVAISHEQISATGRFLP